MYAAYADSSWDKFISALNLLETCFASNNLIPSWPLSAADVSFFIHWCTFVRGLTADTIKSYMSNLRLIHKLRNLDTSNCESFLCKAEIMGVKNLQFYNNKEDGTKKVMILPILRLLGHEIAISDWPENSKMVVWSAFTLAFWDSFRMGELLPKNENTFNKYETLLWSDLRFVDEDSIQIHIKIPKTRTANGECPVQAIRCLMQKMDANLYMESPIFAYRCDQFLNMNKLNRILEKLLEPHFGEDAKLYSCKSFRAALPSALAAFPNLGNKVAIKRWGRWNSEAFERYTRLNHNAKK